MSGSDCDSHSEEAPTTREETQPRTLYVGNLDRQMTEEFLSVLFSQIGHVNGCKVIQEPNGDPYAFIEFREHLAASTALATMNKRNCFGKEMKVNWASSPCSQSKPKPDTSNHYHIFIGDLSLEVETQNIIEAFAVYGEISDCRVVRDPQTLKSKGYGFVSYVKKSAAEAAIHGMNGQWLGNRSIRTNWASRKPPPPKTETRYSKNLNFEDIYNQASDNNCTVYCGGIVYGLSEELMQETFSPFGQIQEVRVFKEKGYSFIRFANKTAAANAIFAVHNMEIYGQTAKCSWGREAGDPTGAYNQQQPYDYGSVAASTQYPYGYATSAQSQQMAYWYPQGYSTDPMQNSYYQGMQAGFNPFGNYGYHQGYMEMGAQGAPPPPPPARMQAPQQQWNNPAARGQYKEEGNVGATSFGQGGMTASQSQQKKGAAKNAAAAAI